MVDFVADLEAHGGDPGEVRHVCMDMSAAYAKGVGMALPSALISYDRFHVVAMAVVAMAVDAMAKVRQGEMAELQRNCANSAISDWLTYSTWARDDFLPDEARGCGARLRGPYQESPDRGRQREQADVLVSTRHRDRCHRLTGRARPRQGVVNAKWNDS